MYLSILHHLPPHLSIDVCIYLSIIHHLSPHLSIYHPSIYIWKSNYRTYLSNYLYPYLAIYYLMTLSIYHPGALSTNEPPLTNSHEYRIFPTQNIPFLTTAVIRIVSILNWGGGRGLRGSFLFVELFPGFVTFLIPNLESINPTDQNLGLALSNV